MQKMTQAGAQKAGAQKPSPHSKTRMTRMTQDIKN